MAVGNKFTMEYFILLLLPITFAPLYKVRASQIIYSVVTVYYFVLLIFFAGLRWQTGTDWHSYFDHFSSGEFEGYVEVGYAILVSIIRPISSKYTIFLLIDSAVALIPVWWFLRTENRCHPLSLSIFFSGYFTGNYLGSNRRIIAMGLCLLALIPLSKRKLIPFICLTFLAFCFHLSAIAFLFAWPIFHFRHQLKSWHYFVLIAASLLLQVVNPFQILANIAGTIPHLVLLQKLLWYSGNVALVPGRNYLVQNATSIGKRLIIISLLLHCRSRVPKSKCKHYLGYLNLYIFASMIYIIASGNAEIFKIVSFYFSIIEIVLIPAALASMGIAFRPIIYLFFIGYMVVQQYAELIPYWDLYVPYQSVLNKVL